MRVTLFVDENALIERVTPSLDKEAPGARATLIVEEEALIERVTLLVERAAPKVAGHSISFPAGQAPSLAPQWAVHPK